MGHVWAFLGNAKRSASWISHTVPKSTFYKTVLHGELGH